jgi:hypothetical protein
LIAKGIRDDEERKKKKKKKKREGKNSRLKRINDRFKIVGKG